MITVGHVRDFDRKSLSFYVGRYNRPHSLAGSPFANPFHLHSEDLRRDVLLEFADYWYSSKQKKLREKALITFPENSTLLCWCHPRLCHADIVAGYINAKRLGLI